jgi:hypothetical protein
MLRRLTLARTDVSDERIASIIRVTRIGELETTLAVTSNRSTLRRNTIAHSSPILVTLMMVAIISSDSSVLTRATRRNIPEDGIFLDSVPTFKKHYLFLQIRRGFQLKMDAVFIDMLVPMKTLTFP